MGSLCECGCGSYTEEGNRFIHGHNRRNLASYTSGERWSMKHAACVGCGTIELKHAGLGLCVSCYKKHLYNKHKNKWSKKYNRCINCGTTHRAHAARGLCNTCYYNELNRKKGVPKRNFGAWSWYYNRCQKCGTTKREHAANGLCVDCVGVNKRDLINAVICPVCRVKVNKINQHLAVRAKKCEEHRKHQYDRFKMYFESDMTLHAIGKELGMDRHAITRQFVIYFGEDITTDRNEKIKRCNISEKAVINKNYSLLHLS